MQSMMFRAETLFIGEDGYRVQHVQDTRPEHRLHVRKTQAQTNPSSTSTRSYMSLPPWD